MLEVDPSVSMKFQMKARFAGEYPRGGFYGSIYLVSRERICGECNSGWMSILQNNSIPAVAALISGQRVILAESAQTQIAAWFTMLSMVLDCVPSDESKWYFTAGERARFRTEGEIPAVATFWLGYREKKWRHQDRPILGSGTTFTFVNANAPNLLMVPSLVSTFALFHVVIQLLIYRLPTGVPDPLFSRKDAVEAPFRDMTRRFGPPKGELAWPPSPMDDVALAAFMNRWTKGSNPVARPSKNNGA